MAQATQGSRPGQVIFDALARKNDQLFWGGVAMAVVGALALVFPFGATFAIAVMAGWLLILAGGVTIADAFTVEGTGPFFGELLIGLLKLALGVYLVRHPDVSMVLLTLLLAAVFVIDGAAQLALAFELRPLDGWGWLLLSGIIAIAVGSAACRRAGDHVARFAGHSARRQLLDHWPCAHRPFETPVRIGGRPIVRRTEG